MLVPIADVQMHSLAEANLLTSWAVLGAAVVGTAIVLFRPKFRAKKDPMQRSPESGSLAQHRSVERQMQNLLVELSEMSRQVTAGLDTRAAKLDALIREADEKIAVLSALCKGIPAVDLARSFSDHGNGSAARAISDRSTGPTEQFMAAEPQSDVPASMSPAAASPYDSDPRHAEVYLLADQGQSASEIAAQLQRPTGEIQLILALRTR